MRMRITEQHRLPKFVILRMIWGLIWLRLLVIKLFLLSTTNLFKTSSSEYFYIIWGDKKEKDSSSSEMARSVRIAQEEGIWE
jgi:hypothetical protein